jgi:hypothetical protein
VWCDDPHATLKGMHVPRQNGGHVAPAADVSRRVSQRRLVSDTVTSLSQVFPGGNSWTIPSHEECILAGVELMHLRKKAPMVGEEGEASQTPAEQFYALAA